MKLWHNLQNKEREQGLEHITNLSHARNLITCTVGAPRIRHGVPMVPISVHFKNLTTRSKKTCQAISIM